TGPFLPLTASLALSSFGVTPPMLFFFAITVPDTVMCRKIKGECSFLLCSLFKRSIGTCYNGLAKCCIPFHLYWFLE
uniref:Beta-defensin-like domain-containing protein n=1 Tax=Cairina moschata TaxID=8855 RepID=A0A8C3GG62_CAIMO